MDSRNERKSDIESNGRVRSFGRIASWRRVGQNLGEVGKGQFDGWSKFEIVETLIRYGKVLRDEQYISVGNLRVYAEHVFKGIEIPQKPAPYSLQEQRRRHNAAIKIQNYYFQSQIIRSERARAKNKKSDRLLRGISHISRTYSNMNRAQSNVQGLNNLEDDNNFESQDQDDDEENVIQEEPWIAPSWEYAKVYANYQHPRLGGFGGAPMDVIGTTTGRHCTSGGCGSQFDLFEEKQVSELGRYGPGITNYFKFLKWCFWIFAVLSVIYLPILILNTFGHGMRQSSQLNDLSATMAGNLGDTNNTYTIHFPGCAGDVRGQNCNMEKDRVGVVYCYLDFVAVILVMVGYVWLRAFETKEEIVLDKNTVTAANYSITVRGLPNVAFTERELMKHFAEVTNQAVATVTIAYDNEREIDLYTEKGRYIAERIKCIQEYRYYRTLKNNGDSRITDEFLITILAKKNKVTDHIREIEKRSEELSKSQQTPIYAFITFESIYGAKLAVKEYNRSMWGYFNMPNRLRFKGSRLLVKPAPEPSTILWENLRYKRVDRVKRRVLTNIVTFVLLAISALANIGAQSVQRTASDAGGDSYCPSSFFSSSQDDQILLVESDPDLLHCYCDQYTYMEQSEDDMCKDYFKKTLQSQIIIYMAAFVVLVINNFIDMFLNKSGKFEKHHSADAQERSIFIRMFVMKFINTGVLFILLSTVPELNELFGSTYSEGNFTTAWYKSIGVSIALVQFGDIGIQHFWKFYSYRIHAYKLQQAKKNPLNGALTQNQLNKLHLGPEFLVSHRYAQIMADLWVCFIFCTGMPVLVIVCMANIAVSYWVDKFLFLRFYRSPPRYKTKIGVIVTSTIPFAIILHLIVAIWTLSNEDLFSSKSNVNTMVDMYGNTYNSYNLGNRCTKPQTFPLFCLLVITIIGILFGNLIDDIVSSISAVFSRFCCSCFKDSDFLENLEKFQQKNIDIPYTKSVRRGIIKGLVTYNILQNPKYKEAFGITDTFALAHSRVRSLKFFGRISFEDDESKEDQVDEAHVLATPDVLNLARLDDQVQQEFKESNHNRASEDQSVHSRRGSSEANHRFESRRSELDSSHGPTSDARFATSRHGRKGSGGGGDDDASVHSSHSKRSARDRDSRHRTSESRDDDLESIGSKHSKSTTSRAEIEMNRGTTTHNKHNKLFDTIPEKDEEKRDSSNASNFFDTPFDGGDLHVVTGVLVDSSSNKKSTPSKNRYKSSADSNDSGGEESNVQSSRPISAYVDYNASYQEERSHTLRPIVHEANPLKDPSRRNKSVTVDSYVLESQIRGSSAVRRSSIQQFQDKGNITAFKENKSRRRSSASSNK